MIAKTKTVSCAMTNDVVGKIDRWVDKTGRPRSDFVRVAILKHADHLGLIKLDLDDKGEVYSLDAREVAA